MKKAFTLIELLIVIAIISILAAILFPVFAAAREKARQTTCASNLKQCGLGVMQYAQDYDELFPCGGHYGWGATERACIQSTYASGPEFYVWNITGGTANKSVWLPEGDSMWMGLIYPYTKSLGVYYCPDGPNPTESIPGNYWSGTDTTKPTNTNFSYAYNSYVLPTAFWQLGTTVDASCNVTNATTAAPHTQLSQFSSASTTYMLVDRGQYDRGSGALIAGFSPKGTSSGAGSDNIDITVQKTGHNPGTRHNGGAQYCFVDGHVKFLSSDQYFAQKPAIVDGGISY